MRIKKTFTLEKTTGIQKDILVPLIERNNRYGMVMTVVDTPLLTPSSKYLVEYHGSTMSIHSAVSGKVLWTTTDHGTLLILHAIQRAEPHSITVLVEFDVCDADVSEFV